jgi:hypothetical protein
MVFSLEHDIKVTKNHQNLLPTQSVLVAHTVVLHTSVLFKKNKTDSYKKSLGRITTPLLNMTLITMVTNLSLSGRLQLHKSISFLFTLITILINDNFNNGVVIRPIVSKLLN